MRAQLEHQVEAINGSFAKHDDPARILQALLAKLQLIEKDSPGRPPPEESALDPPSSSTRGGLPPSRPHLTGWATP
jgi:hypothetical protein